MESSFDPGIDGLQSEASAVTTGDIARSTMSVASTPGVTMSVGGTEDSSKPHTNFTPLLRPGSMGTVSHILSDVFCTESFFFLWRSFKSQNFF